MSFPLTLTLSHQGREGSWDFLASISFAALRMTNRVTEHPYILELPPLTFKSAQFTTGWPDPG